MDGILIGIGLALVLKANTSTGGTDLIAHIAQNYKINLKMSTIITIVDGIVIAANLFAFKNLEIGLYSVIAIYIIGKMIDIVFEGIQQKFIIRICGNPLADQRIQICFLFLGNLVCTHIWHSFFTCIRACISTETPLS